MDKVAIVILNWNGAKMLRQYLPTVLNYSRDEATVYVADNASTDDSLELLRRDFPECEVIVLDKNWTNIVEVVVCISHLIYVFYPLS